MESLETPLGTLQLSFRGDALRALSFTSDASGPPARSRTADLIRAYFAGDLEALNRIAVDPDGTPFQERVWALLREIPPGETRTYSDLAQILGTQPRAVDSANGRNPIALVIPCHRVIAKGGSLCGYAWGEDRKRWLLDHELSAARHQPAPALPLAAVSRAR